MLFEVPIELDTADVYLRPDSGCAQPTCLDLLAERPRAYGWVRSCLSFRHPEISLKERKDLRQVLQANVLSTTIF